MSTYRMEDGTIVKTENATEKWSEGRDWDGRNHVGRSSRSQWHDQNLYKSKKGRYYVEHCSRVQGERDWCEWVSPQQAAAWLLLNEADVPDDLKEAATDIEE